MAKDVIVTADAIHRRRKVGKLVGLTLIILLLLLIVIYIILQVVYNEGKFTVSLDSNATLESGINIYESLNDPTGKRKLYSQTIGQMDNISIKWLPENIDAEAEGYFDLIINGNSTDVSYSYTVTLSKATANTVTDLVIDRYNIDSSTSDTTFTGDTYTVTGNVLYNDTNKVHTIRVYGK